AGELEKAEVVLSGRRELEAPGECCPMGPGGDGVEAVKAGIENEPLGSGPKSEVHPALGPVAPRRIVAQLHAIQFAPLHADASPSPGGDAVIGHLDARRLTLGRTNPEENK